MSLNKSFSKTFIEVSISKPLKSFQNPIFASVLFSNKQINNESMYFCRVPYGGWWPPGGCNSRSTAAASSASDTEDASAASDEVVYAFSKSRAGETPSQPPSWPQSQSNRKRGSTSPTLPDEELTSMLQSYLDDTAKKYSTSNSKSSAEEAKMDLEYLNQQDYYYPNQTFLPNVSPSASSLDSGYCGPASVQSSVESPHNLGKVKGSLVIFHFRVKMHIDSLVMNHFRLPPLSMAASAD